MLTEPKETRNKTVINILMTTSIMKGKRDRTTLSRGRQDPGRVDAVRTGGVEGFAYAR